ncbi:glycosyltransferase [Escherichia coli]|nr:glycosyltransferase [Escherichia coli]
MSITNKTIALVIVTYNRCNLLMEMLSSIENMSVKPDIVYVIDNNSSDNTSSVVTACDSRKNINIKYHNTGYNAGGAGGFYIGSKMAYEDGWDRIWLADDDIVLDKECLSNAMEYDDGRTILQPMRYNMDGSCAEISAIQYDLSNPFYLRPKRKTVQNIFNKNILSYDIQSIPFEGPIIPREVFNVIGFPDERFFIFNDDLDFAIRAQRAGFSIKCITNAKIVRKIPFVQSVALKTWKGYFMFRNYFRVQKVYGSSPLIYLRILLVFCLALGHSLVRMDINSIKMLCGALKDGLSQEFKLTEKYKP